MGATAKHQLPWPANTDLVKDGAAGIRALAEAVDARLSGALFRATADGENVGHDVVDRLDVNLTSGDSTVFTDQGNTIRYNGPTVIATVFAQVVWAANAAGYRRLAINQSNTEVIFIKESPDAEGYAQSVSWPVTLSDGATLGMEVRQTSGGVLAVTSGRFRCVVHGIQPA